MDSRDEEYAAEIEWIKAYILEHPLSPYGLRIEKQYIDNGEKRIVTSPHFPEFKAVLTGENTVNEDYYALCEWIRSKYLTHIIPITISSQ